VVKNKWMLSTIKAWSTECRSKKKVKPPLGDLGVKKEKKR